MSDQVAQTLAPQPQQAPRPFDGSDASRQIALDRARRGELLDAADLAAIFRIGKARFYQLQWRGAFDGFKVRPALGPRRFSGVLVQRYLNGDPVFEQARVFGRKRA